MTDLAETWLKLPGVDPVDLERAGVSFRAAQMVGGVRQGRTGWILACYVDPPSIWRSVEDPVILDFVLFDPARPSLYRTCYGASAMLGEEALSEARFHKLPLPVFKTPLTWLQEGGAGVVVLDPLAFGRAMFNSDVRLVAEDLAHAEQLQDITRRAVRLAYPVIRVAA